MTNKEAIDRWAEQIIPAVFKAEDALQKVKPGWKERLARLGEPGGEDPHKVAEEYCREIAAIIVTQGSDYEPDGSIDGALQDMASASERHQETRQEIGETNGEVE